jgi:uncharacterized protein (UPF0335 family)
MADRMKVINELEDSQLKQIQVLINALHALEEEKKSINEDIKEEVAKAAKEIGIKPTNLKDILKAAKMAEKGFDFEAYADAIKKLNSGDL